MGLADVVKENWKEYLKFHPPDKDRFENARILISLVPHGYEIDFSVNGEKKSFVCRDYGNNIKSVKVVAKFISKIIKITSKLA